MGGYACICEGVVLVYVRECMRVCEFLSVREYVYAWYMRVCVRARGLGVYATHTYCVYDVRVCMCVCACACEYVHGCAHVSMFLCILVYMGIRVSAFVNVSVCVFMSVYVVEYMSECVCEGLLCTMYIV